MTTALKGQTRTKKGAATSHLAPILQKIVKLIDEKKGTNTIIFAMDDSPLLVDFIIITGADNPRKLRAIAQNVKKGLSPQEPFAIEGTNSTAWIVMDYVDFLVHIFSDEARSFYDLEGLFGEPLWRSEED